MCLYEVSFVEFERILFKYEPQKFLVNRLWELANYARCIVIFIGTANNVNPFCLKDQRFV